MLIVLKSGSLKLLEPSGPVQACNGVALPFYLFLAVHFQHHPVAPMSCVFSYGVAMTGTDCPVCSNMFYYVFTTLKYFATLYHTRHEADRSTKSIAEVNKAWRYNSTSQYTYMLSWRLINYKGTLIFFAFTATSLRK